MFHEDILFYSDITPLPPLTHTQWLCIFPKYHRWLMLRLFFCEFKLSHYICTLKSPVPMHFIILIRTSSMTIFIPRVHCTRINIHSTVWEWWLIMFLKHTLRFVATIYLWLSLLHPSHRFATLVGIYRPKLWFHYCELNPIYQKLRIGK